MGRNMTLAEECALDTKIIARKVNHQRRMGIRRIYYHLMQEECAKFTAKHGRFSRNVGSAACHTNKNMQQKLKERATDEYATSNRY